MLKKLLELQKLDLRIEACRKREAEIPKQKNKFEVQKQRLAAELAEREKSLQDLKLEQRNLEGEIDQHQQQVKKYDQQLYAIKDNDQYQALLHEIDFLKKQVALKEEKIIELMMKLDDAKARLDEDRKRIEQEVRDIQKEFAAIDAELAQAQADRADLEAQRAPIADEVENELLDKYTRIRASKKTGPAAVPVRGQVCTGCQMSSTPQVINELMAGRVHTCRHCGRLLYYPDRLEAENSEVSV